MWLSSIFQRCKVDLYPTPFFTNRARQILEPILSKLLNSLSRFCHEHLVVKHPEYQKSSLASTFVGNPMGGMAEGAHNEIISQCVQHCFQGKGLSKPETPIISRLLVEVCSGFLWGRKKQKTTRKKKSKQTDERTNRRRNRQTNSKRKSLFLLGCWFWRLQRKKTSSTWGQAQVVPVEPSKARSLGSPDHPPYHGY